MHWKRTLAALAACLLWSGLAAAQEDIPSVLEIAYDQVVEETISAAAIYDWWQVQAAAGDILVVDMQGLDGLEPLIGLLDPDGNLAARSPEGQADESVSLEFMAPQAGQYTIIATRAGNAQGISTGSYALRLRRANAPAVAADDDLQDVTFRCEDFEVTTAATLRFNDDPRTDMRYRITVYGLDGFVPVIRVSFLAAGQPEPFVLCNTNADETVGDSFTLPGEAERTITESDLASVSQLAVSGLDAGESLEVTIGSRDGAPGRYLAVIDGLSIDAADDVDSIEMRIGPLAATGSALTVYAVGPRESRLDPALAADETTCDDAGRGECSGVSAWVGSQVTLNESRGLVLRGDRQDAGLVLAPGDPDPIGVQVSSSGGRSFGSYALLLLGALPPRQSGP